MRSSILNFVSIAIVGCWHIAALAASSSQFSSVWETEKTAQTPREMDVSAFIEKDSQWKIAEIEKRILTANQVLASCGLRIRNVYFHKWDLTPNLLRIDDIESTIEDITEKFYDGMRYTSQQTNRVTAIQLFYFEDYLNPHTYGGSVPLSVYGDKFPLPLQNSVWFPYNSAQRRKFGESQYSEEAHEIGHILTRKGHDHSGASNVMANSSVLRAPGFSSEQCASFLIPAHTAYIQSCKNSSEAIFPLFSSYFNSYSDKTYMNTWCSRNSDNLQKAILALNLASADRVKGLYITHKDKNQRLYPLNSRQPNSRWPFHAALLVDDMVLDMDYTNRPTLVKLDEYLEKMWGNAAADLEFQLRPSGRLSGYTRVEVFETFKNNTFPEYTKAELLAWVRAQGCK